MQWKSVGALATAGMMLAACGDSTGPGATGEMDVRLTTRADVSGGTLGSVLGESAGGMAPISLEAIDSINLTLTGIDAGRGTETDDWVHLALVEEGQARIDLMALPVDDDPGGVAGDTVRLARGEVPVGTYTGVRLRYDVATATITLNREVTVGQRTYAAGTHALAVPSGAQTGVKLPFQTLVIGSDEEADVVLVFDGEATIQNANATGSGSILLSPVMHARASIED